eukprot:Nitzschia sp. Nitz4//scaffold278_size24532//5324//6238//NITZ4_008373-RA/size24532-augustus-gene-0.11-mRNA-1//1//CDS//3329545369//6986//frame0
MSADHMSTNSVSEVTVSLLHHLRRRLDSTPEMAFNQTGDDTEVMMGGDFDPKLFWSVNGFIFFMLLSACLWCCFADKDWLMNMHARRMQTEAEYQATLRERAEQRRLAKIVTPEQRRKRLLQSFARHKVTMEVTSDDIVHDDPSHFFKKPEKDVEDPETPETSAASDSAGDHLSLTSFENKGQLRLNTGNLVPNCCAICLGEYDVGDKVVWSSNSECNHAFHEDCILDWLIKMQPLTPCPCCRQEFTDLELVRKEKKITWSGDAFNLSAVRF